MIIINNSNKSTLYSYFYNVLSYIFMLKTTLKKKLLTFTEKNCKTVFIQCLHQNIYFFYISDFNVSETVH